MAIAETELAEVRSRRHKTDHTLAELLQLHAGWIVDFAVYEHVLGWKWWAYSYKERERYGKPFVEVVVRSLRQPDFPNHRWAAWGAKQSHFAPATGSEPIISPEGTGGMMSIPDYHHYSGIIWHAWELAEMFRMSVLHDSPGWVAQSGDVSAWAPDAPLAICRCALKLKMN